MTFKCVSMERPTAVRELEPREPHQPSGFLSGRDPSYSVCADPPTDRPTLITSVALWPELMSLTCLSAAAMRTRLVPSRRPEEHRRPVRRHEKSKEAIYTREEATMYTLFGTYTMDPRSDHGSPVGGAERYFFYLTFLKGPTSLNVEGTQIALNLRTTLAMAPR